MPTSRKGREKWGTLYLEVQKVGHSPLRADFLIVEVRGTHPFAKNAKGWGTLVYTVLRKGTALIPHSSQQRA